MSTQTIDHAPTQATERKLNQLHDRCDRCGAQAFVAVTIPVPARATNVELLFCGHHYSRHEQVFASQGYQVHDERHLINDKPSVSANAD